MGVRVYAGSPGYEFGTLLPTREDDVAAWLRRRRDEYSEKGCGWTEWAAAYNQLLDEYRDRADTGTPLSHALNAEEGRPL